MPEFKYEIIASRKGPETVRLTKGQKEIYLHSKYDPIKEAKAFADNIYSEDVEVFLVIGLALGYHIQALMEKLKAQQQIIILEANDSLYKLADERGLYEVLKKSPQVRIELALSLNEYISLFTKFASLDQMKIVTYAPALETLPGNFSEIKEIIEEFRVKEQTMISSSERMLKNFHINIKNYDCSIDKLFGMYKDKVIIVVAAGPSLDKNAHLLKNIGNNAVIIAVGRAMRSLVSADVKPNYIISTDSKEHVHKQFMTNDMAKGIDIIGLSTTDKHIFEKHEGRKYLALQEGLSEAEDYASKKGYKLVDTGGSVATTALDIAIRMGGNPIIMVGQDLAYTDGRSHSSGTNHRDVSQIPNLRQIHGYIGGQVYTNRTLHMYLRWFENKIKETNEINKKIKFIDATEGGARIKGTEIMTLQEVIDKYISS